MTSIIVTDIEGALASIETFIDTTVWPDLKKFLLVFSPAEAKIILGDIIAAIPTATSVENVISDVGSEIGGQTVTNAETAVEEVVAPGTTTTTTTTTTPATEATS